MAGKKEFFSYGNNPSIVIQIKILQSHSFLPLVSSLSTTDSSRRNDRDKKKLKLMGSYDMAECLGRRA